MGENLKDDPDMLLDAVDRTEMLHQLFDNGLQKHDSCVKLQGAGLAGAVKKLRRARDSILDTVEIDREVDHGNQDTREG